MVEIIVTIALEVAKCLAPPTARQINYLRQYKSNFQNLKAEVEELKTKHTNIQHRVDDAKRKGEEIEDFVLNWLERASKVINEEAPKFDEDENTATTKRCFKGLCPDLKTRHQLSKQKLKQMNALAKLLQQASSFDIISYRTISEDPRLSNKDYEAFDSRNSTLTNVINSLCDPNVNIVGIYGMGGIGKTTLAKKVAEEAEKNKLFGRVVFVEVTQKPDQMKIQGEIAEKLGLQLSQEEQQSTRAGKLHQQLKNEKTILIILDNVWAHLDLQAIGIPLGDEHKGCKMLLTARRLDLLSEKMDSQRNFPVGILNDEEAWRLFKKMNGDHNIDGGELKPVAAEVAKKCAGLPIAIVTVARALRNKGLFVWRNALQKLRMSSSEYIQGIQITIELSYDHLESKVLKKTMLLIGYANLTSIDELVMYGTGLDLFERINNMEGRRDEVRTLVQQLKESCLLLESDISGADFSVHDVVRDAVMSIASRDRHAFTKESGELVWPDKNTLKAYTSIVLKDVKESQLPSVLECQQLRLLSISATQSDSFFTIDDKFFTRMTELKVLMLANMGFPSLPSSFRFLKNLQVLGLYKCSLEDTSIIGDLKKLEILSLKNSYIQQLSVEIGHLTQLKSLDLRVRLI